jgi:hypothetical protein
MKNTLKIHTSGGIVEGKYISHDAIFVTIEIIESYNKKMIGRVEKFNRDELILQFDGHFAPEVDDPAFGKEETPPQFPPITTRPAQTYSEHMVGKGSTDSSSIAFRVVGWIAILGVFPFLFMSVCHSVDKTLTEGLLLGLLLDAIIALIISTTLIIKRYM